MSRPWHSQLQGYLSDSIILFVILLLLMISSQQPLDVPKCASPEEGLEQRAFLFDPGKEEIKEGAVLVLCQSAPDSCGGLFYALLLLVSVV